MSGSISSELGRQILKEYLTETPRPSCVTLATRHGLRPRAVQRYVRKHVAVAETVTQNGHDGKTAELVVAALPGAVREVKEISQGLAVRGMIKVLDESELQYEKLKDSTPQLAGHYLELMRKAVMEIGGWLHMSEGILPAAGAKRNGPGEACQGCPYQSRQKMLEFLGWNEGERKEVKDGS